MFNYKKLKGKIVEKFGTINSFIEAWGMTYCSLQNKLTGKTFFTQRDMMEIIKLLDLTVEDIPAYFFAK